MKQFSRYLSIMIVLVALIEGGEIAKAETRPYVGFAGMSTPPPSEPVNATSSCFRMIGALCLCLGVFAGGVQIYRRYGGISRTGTTRRLVIHERLSLNSKSSLVLVSLDGREFLVSSGTEHVNFMPSPKVSELDFGESLHDACSNSGAFDV